MLVLVPCASRGGEETVKSPYEKWKNGPPTDPNFFPICVWCQDPAKNGERYKAIGINTFVALWDGPSEADLDALKKAGLKTICAQNAVGLKHKDDPTIIAWMHGDEPDNAQTFKNYWKSDIAKMKEAWPDVFKDLTVGGSYKGYGAPVPPKWIVRDYAKLREADPSRPILLNLGQGVAWDGYFGRGERTGKTEDYPEYIKGGDIVSFDIYPVTHSKPAVAGKLWYVPQGVERLRKWAGDEKPVWNCIECTHVENPNAKPTPAQVKSEVWMALIAGSKGLIYFCHEFKPKQIEAGLLADAAMAEAVGKINKQIHELAPALNAPAIAGATVESSNKDAPIAMLAKKTGGSTFVFAVNMRDAAATGKFEIKGLAKASAEVLGEQRKIDVAGGKFADEFKGYEVHLYKMADK
jgi:hypothetical protein